MKEVFFLYETSRLDFIVHCLSDQILATTLVINRLIIEQTLIMAVIPAVIRRESTVSETWMPD